MPDVFKLIWNICNWLRKLMFKEKSFLCFFIEDNKKLCRAQLMIQNSFIQRKIHSIFTDHIPSKPVNFSSQRSGVDLVCGRHQNNAVIFCFTFVYIWFLPENAVCNYIFPHPVPKGTNTPTKYYIHENVQIMISAHKQMLDIWGYTAPYI